MEKHLIVQVPNSANWDDKEKEKYREMLINFLKDKYKVVIIFNEKTKSNLTKFQVLEHPKLINFLRSVLFNFRFKKTPTN
jgi:hypothetical protein